MGTVSDRKLSMLRIKKVISNGGRYVKYMVLGTTLHVSLKLQIRIKSIFHNTYIMHEIWNCQNMDSASFRTSLFVTIRPRSYMKQIFCKHLCPLASDSPHLKHFNANFHNLIKIYHITITNLLADIPYDDSYLAWALSWQSAYLFQRKVRPAKGCPANEASYLLLASAFISLLANGIFHFWCCAVHFDVLSRVEEGTYCAVGRLPCCISRYEHTCEES